MSHKNWQLFALAHRNMNLVLTTKILRVVNSSIFGLSHKVSDLGQALALLGTKPLKMLVLGFSLPSGMTSKGHARGAMGQVLNRYWRTTLIKAVAARRLAQTAFAQRTG